MPSFTAGLIAALSISLVWRLCRPNAALARTITWVSGASLLAVYATPVAIWLAWPLENAFSSHSPDPSIPAPLIVHLSGAERLYLSGLAQDALLADQHGRYVEAMRLLTSYPESKIVFSGGAKDGDVTDIAVAKTIYQRAQLLGRFVGQGSARNTFENGRDVAAYIEETGWKGTFLLVTSAAHMPRAMLSFQAHGLEPMAAPAAAISPKVGFWRSWSVYSARMENFTIFERCLHEWVGLLYYRLKGRTKALWPSNAR